MVGVGFGREVRRQIIQFKGGGVHLRQFRDVFEIFQIPKNSNIASAPFTYKPLKNLRHKKLSSREFTKAFNKLLKGSRYAIKLFHQPCCHRCEKYQQHKSIFAMTYRE